MKGHVDWLNRPMQPLTVRGPYGHEQGEAMIDTGFTNSLTLPSSVVQRLGLRRESIAPSRLADGSVANAYTYWVDVDWVDGPRRCIVFEVDLPEWLIGRSLLDGYLLEIDFGTTKKVEVR